MQMGWLLGIFILSKNGGERAYLLGIYGAYVWIEQFILQDTAFPPVGEQVL
jgi:hypothetical protein